MGKGPTPKQIVAAIARLKPGDMTARGAPKVAAVAKALGQPITRRQIDKAVKPKTSTGKSGKALKSAPKPPASRKSSSSATSAPSSQKKPKSTRRTTSSTSKSKSTAQSSGTGSKSRSASGADHSTSSTSNARARARDGGEDIAEDGDQSAGRGHRGGPPLTVETVVGALQSVSGVRAQAAKRLGVDRSAITHFINRHPEVLEALDDIRETMLDLGEGKLLLALNAGEGWAIRYFLEQHGHERGYGKKVTVKGDPAAPLHTRPAGPDYVKLLREGTITKDDLKAARDLQRKIEAADGSTSD